MQVFPNAKINIGLDLLRKREDGFHELETLMIPIPLCDELSFEVNEKNQATTLTNNGIRLDGNYEDNLVYKAYTLLKKEHALPNLSINLNKVIPFGAGLGGGSADASFMLSALNSFFKLELSIETLETYAAQLGSDCPIFIQNQPAMAKGRGEILSEYTIKLNGMYLVLIIPNIAISTPAAYQLVKPSIPETKLAENLKRPIHQWKDFIKNDFEVSVFKQFPKVKEVKDKLYELGATYASLSGSGAAVFGLFEQKHDYTKAFPENYFKWDCII